MKHPYFWCQFWDKKSASYTWVDTVNSYKTVLDEMDREDPAFPPEDVVRQHVDLGLRESERPQRNVLQRLERIGLNRSGRDHVAQVQTLRKQRWEVDNPAVFLPVRLSGKLRRAEKLCCSLQQCSLQVFAQNESQGQ